jgi:hypothetical protein
MRIARICPLLCLLFAACASSPDGDGNHTDVVAKYTLQPGEEKYLCYTVQLPADRELAITRMTPTYGVSTHHILFAQTLVDEAAGMSECAVLIRDTWLPLYTGGVSSGPLVLPAKTGFTVLKPGQQLLLQLHLQNASDTPVTDTTTMRVEYTDVTPDLIHAGIFGLDNRKLDIPAHTDAALNEMSCTIDRDLGVFAVIGHMHKHGAHLDVSRGATAGDEMLYAEDWSFETQPVTPATFTVHKNDMLHLRCTHKNSSDQPVAWGESSDTEMCAFVMFYAPATGISGCLNQ